MKELRVYLIIWAFVISASHPALILAEESSTASQQVYETMTFDAQKLADSDIGSLGSFGKDVDKKEYFQLVFNLLTIGFTAVAAAHMATECLGKIASGMSLNPSEFFNIKNGVKGVNLTPISFWVFELAALAYLGFEIYYITQFKAFGRKSLDEIEKIRVHLVRDPNDSNYSLQVETLNTLLDQLKKNKKLIHDKWIAMMVLTGAIGVSAVIAIVETILNKPNFYLSCVNQTPEEQDQIQKLQKEQDELLKKAPVKLPSSVFLDWKTIWKAISPLLASIPIKELVADDCSTTITSSMAEDYGDSSQAGKKECVLDARKSDQFKDMLFDSPLQTEFLSWYVGTITAGAGLGIAVGAASLASDTVKKVVHKAIVPPLGRSILFSAVTSVFIAATVLLDRTKNRYDEKIKSVENILSALEKMTKGVTSLTNKAAQSKWQKLSKVKPLEKKIGGNLDSNNATSPCLTKNYYSNYKIDKNCTCEQTQSCLNSNVGGILGGFSVPGLNDSSLGQMDSTMNQLATGNFNSASLNTGNLSNYAAENKQLNDQLKDKFNQDRKGQGLDPIDFPKAEANLLTQLQKAVQSSLFPDSKQQIIAPSNLEQHLSDALAGDQSAEGKKEDAGIDGIKRLNAEESKDAAPEQNLDFLMEDEKKQLAIHNQEAEDPSATLDQQFNSDYEVNPDAQKSIFNLLSHRYMKSAYPWFFQRK